jgi:hypothetical protein
VKILQFGAGADHAVEQLANFLVACYYMHHKRLFELKEDSYKLMHIFDWKSLVKNYLAAYSAALEKGNFAQAAVEKPPAEDAEPLSYIVAKKAIPASAGRQPAIKAKGKK